MIARAKRIVLTTIVHFCRKLRLHIAPAGVPYRRARCHSESESDGNNAKNCTRYSVEAHRAVLRFVSYASSRSIIR